MQNNDYNFYKMLEDIQLDCIEALLDKKINERNVMAEKLIRYVTPTCPYCKSATIIMVSEKSLRDWQNGVHIQDAFIDMVTDEREMLKTGIHPECWLVLFNDIA